VEIIPARAPEIFLVVINLKFIARFQPANIAN
jgi:hypothetical protein